MKRFPLFVTIVLLLFVGCSKKNGTSNSGSNACATQKSDAENMPIFPASNAWNQDISGAAVDAYSTPILSAYAGTGLHADFGSGLYQGKTIGIPFSVVCGSQQKLPIVFRQNAVDGNFGSESDPGPYPIPLNAPIEQGGDAHVIVVDKDNAMLYELYNANVNGDHWEASSGAVFNLASNALRPDGWTSADAAGLPIFAGLVRYDEVLSGTIDHALRFTLARGNTLAAHIAPARHEGNGTGTALAALPFGARIRLKASVDISGYPAQVRVILKALKKYGLILADIGSNMYISGAPDERWNNDDLQQLSKVKASDFEVVKFNP